MSLLNDDIHYLPLRSKIDILKELKDIAYDIKIDELDCSKSWARQPVDISFEEALTRMTNFHHFTIIRRNLCEPEDYIEACLSSLNAQEPNTFIWLKIKPEFITNIKKIIFRYMDEKSTKKKR